MKFWMHTSRPGGDRVPLPARYGGLPGSVGAFVDVMQRVFVGKERLSARKKRWVFSRMFTRKKLRYGALGVSYGGRVSLGKDGVSEPRPEG